MTINWFPGHMEKARKQMEEQLKLVDVVIELRDARIPNASKNPILMNMANNKPRLIILNKADLADSKQNFRWLETLDNCLLINSIKDDLSKIISSKLKVILSEKIEKAKSKGIRKKVLRGMIVGIPNVGKSTFINSFVKKKATIVENRPGVTRKLQWIRINNDIELLDTPGVLWPKIDNQEDAKMLALIGSIGDAAISDKQELVSYGLSFLKDNYPNMISAKYGIDESQDNIIDAIALKKGWIIKNNQIDYNKTYDSILKDIRTGSIGRFTLQKC